MLCFLFVIDLVEESIDITDHLMILCLQDVATAGWLLLALAEEKLLFNVQSCVDINGCI